MNCENHCIIKPNSVDLLTTLKNENSKGHEFAFYITNNLYDLVK